MSATYDGVHRGRLSEHGHGAVYDFTPRWQLRQIKACKHIRRAVLRVGKAFLDGGKARFCFVLREIASGDNGRPLSGTEAQQRAQAVLTECGYTWPGRGQACEPAVVRIIARESPKTQAPVQSSTGTKLKKSITAQSRSGRRIDPHPRERGVGASLNGSPA